MTDMIIAEIVPFRLFEGADTAAFAQSATATESFLRGTGVFGARTLSVDDTGLWTDHITWSTVPQTKATAKAIIQRPDATTFLATIDTKNRKMCHAKRECAVVWVPDAPH